MPRPRPRRLRTEEFRCEDLVCCERLKDTAFTGEDRLIHYSPRTREFGIPYGTLRGGGIQLLAFCPWCGARFPLGLRPLYFETVRRVAGQEIALFDPVPRAFRGDRWWREREIPFDQGEDASSPGLTPRPLAGI